MHVYRTTSNIYAPVVLPTSSITAYRIIMHKTGPFTNSGVSIEFDRSRGTPLGRPDTINYKFNIFSRALYTLRAPRHCLRDLPPIDSDRRRNTYARCELKEIFKHFFYGNHQTCQRINRDASYDSSSNNALRRATSPPSSAPS